MMTDATAKREFLSVPGIHVNNNNNFGHLPAPLSLQKHHKSTHLLVVDILSDRVDARSPMANRLGVKRNASFHNINNNNNGNLNGISNQHSVSNLHLSASPSSIHILKNSKSGINLPQFPIVPQSSNNNNNGNNENATFNIPTIPKIGKTTSIHSNSIENNNTIINNNNSSSTTESTTTDILSFLKEQIKSTSERKPLHFDSLTSKFQSTRSKQNIDDADDDVVIDDEERELEYYQDYCEKIKANSIKIASNKFEDRKLSYFNDTSARIWNSKSLIKDDATGNYNNNNNLNENHDDNGNKEDLNNFLDIVDIDESEAFENFLSDELVGPFINSKPVQGVIVLVIIFNIITVAMETSHTEEKVFALFFSVVDTFCVTVFLIEILMKWYVGFYSFWQFNGNIFDFLIVFSSIFMAIFVTNTQESIYPRILRAIRASRLFNLSPSLKMFIQNIIDSLPDISNILFLLFLLMCVFSIVGVNLFGHGVPEYFGDFWKAMSTLFVLITEDGWVNILNLMRARGYTMSGSIFAIIFIVLGAFICINIIVGLVLTNMEMIVTNLNKEEKAKHRQLKDKKNVENEHSKNVEVPVAGLSTLRSHQWRTQKPLQSNPNFNNLTLNKAENYFLIVSVLEKNLIEFQSIKSELDHIVREVLDVNSAAFGLDDEYDDDGDVDDGNGYEYDNEGNLNGNGNNHNNVHHNGENLNASTDMMTKAIQNNTNANLNAMNFLMDASNLTPSSATANNSGNLNNLNVTAAPPRDVLTRLIEHEKEEQELERLEEEIWTESNKNKLEQQSHQKEKIDRAEQWAQGKLVRLKSTQFSDTSGGHDSNHNNNNNNNNNTNNDNHNDEKKEDRPSSAKGAEFHHHHPDHDSAIALEEKGVSQE